MTSFFPLPYLQFRNVFRDVHGNECIEAVMLYELGTSRLIPISWNSVEKSNDPCQQFWIVDDILKPDVIDSDLFETPAKRQE